MRSNLCIIGGIYLWITLYLLFQIKFSSECKSRFKFNQKCIYLPSWYISWVDWTSRCFKCWQLFQHPIKNQDYWILECTIFYSLPLQVEIIAAFKSRFYQYTQGTFCMYLLSIDYSIIYIEKLKTKKLINQYIMKKYIETHLFWWHLRGAACTKQKLFLQHLLINSTK